jgi:hypothetical protein
MAKSAPLKNPPNDSVPWADFLSIHPPDKMRVVSKMGRPMDGLDCKSEGCGGVRTFDCVDSSSKRGYYNYSGRLFLEYKCRNCRETTKIYALICRWEVPEGEELPEGDAVGVMRAVKLGEWPPLGPSTPRKLRQFLGDDIDLFEQGQRAEGQGMGIGAFGYYRRVVENRRTQLFDKLIEAATRLGLDDATLAALTDDRDNWQFSK